MYQFLTEDHGTAAVEYSLFVSLIGMAIVGSVQAIGGNLMEVMGDLIGELGSSNITPGSN